MFDTTRNKLTAPCRAGVYEVEQGSVAFPALRTCQLVCGVSYRQIEVQASFGWP